MVTQEAEELRMTVRGEGSNLVSTDGLLQGVASSSEVTVEIYGALLVLEPKVTAGSGQ